MLIPALFSVQLCELHNIPSKLCLESSRLEKSLFEQHSSSTNHFVGAMTSSPKTPFRERSSPHLFGGGILNFFLE